MRAPRIAELRALSDDDLIERHDMMSEGTSVGLAYFLDEIARRRADRQMAIVVALTVVITFATLVNVALVAWEVLG